ncbi:MAG TPA: redoxin domain-containing protein [Longimicrobiales bacterium]|nr:redoxin domain-containing protein [Longimicrobiales bacterium]
MALQIGDSAPDFSLPAGPGPDRVSLSDYRDEKPVVLLFYPFAYSSTCTDELCAIGDDWSVWEELDAQVLGLSVDSPFVVAKFREELGLDFPLLSDFNKEAATAYDAIYDDFYGSHGVAKRAAFVVDRAGVIRYTWVTEDAGVVPDFAEIRGVLANL